MVVVKDFGCKEGRVRCATTGTACTQPPYPPFPRLPGGEGRLHVADTLACERSAAGVDGFPLTGALPIQANPSSSRGAAGDRLQETATLGPQALGSGPIRSQPGVFRGVFRENHRKGLTDGFLFL